MVHNSSSRPSRTGSLPGAVVAVGVIFCIGTLCKSQSSPQNVIKCRLIVAEELRLDLPGSKLEARLSKSATGLASLAFFDLKNRRSIGVTVGGNGSPTVFLTTRNPNTLTSLELSPAGSAQLELGDAAAAERPSLPPGIRLLDSASIMFIGDNEETWVSIAAEQTKPQQSSIMLLGRGGKRGISLVDTRESNVVHIPSRR